MNCLCCGKPLRTPDETGWHKACIKRFFGTTKLPEIEIDDKTLNLLATETTNKGFTVPGVQKKLSLELKTIKKMLLPFLAKKQNLFPAYQLLL